VSWTKDEINFLIENYSTIGPTKCAIALCKTYASIKGLAKRLNLKKQNRWTKEEENFLVQNYNLLGATNCSKHLYRTTNAIKQKACDLNIIKSQKNYNSWSSEQEQFLINNYSTLGPIECSKQLNITYKAVQAKAQRLGITKFGWTEEEEQFLIENYSNRGPIYCAEKLDRTISAVITKAHILNIQSNTRYNSNIVYIVYFPEIFLYKVGITNSIERRMNEFGQPCVILKTVEYETAQEAAEVERCLLKSVTLVNTGALNNGNTETFIQPSQEIKDFLGEKFSDL